MISLHPVSDTCSISLLRWRYVLLNLGIALFLIGSAYSVQGAPRAELWERWAAHDGTSTLSIEHLVWDDFLQRYVKDGPPGVRVARVHYDAVSPADKEGLDRYINKLTGLVVSEYRPAEQRAFWINLYNALTVQVVLDHYPVDSIQDIDISPGFFQSGPWGKKLVKVEGVELSLNDMEHRILRPIWKDARIHYAVNCASIGCPNLARKAFTADNTESMLDEAARQYVNHPRGVVVDEGQLQVSSIYKWFIDDFGGDDAGVIAHISQYAAPILRESLSGISEIDSDQYDWTLNGYQPEN